MSCEADKKWESLKRRIEKMGELVEEIDSPSVDLSKCCELLEDSTKGRIAENLIELESYLKELIGEAKK